jgi:nitroreductase
MANLPFLDFLKGLYRLIAARPSRPRSLAHNDALQIILERRSIRQFSDQDLPDDVWSAILEAGRLAPSTVNLQTWSFAVFTAREWREFFGKPLPFGARRAAIVLADTHRIKQVIPEFPAAPLCEYTVGVMNASLAAMNLNLAAEALGVSSVMLAETGQTGFYDAGQLAEKLALPPGVVPLLTIVFGYAAGSRPVMPPKLPLPAITFSGRYQESPPEALTDWYQQMQAGYKASHRGDRLANRIDHYKRRIDEAERDLKALVFHEG